MASQRLDQLVLAHGLVKTRSQAGSYIKLGQVSVDGEIVTKPGTMLGGTPLIKLLAAEQYVSRAGLKLASVVELMQIDFKNKTVLDVGSSTGGFTDFALRHGASRVIAVDVGSGQLHQSLRTDPRIELHEKTDIRNFKKDISIDIVLIDVSFISLREILPSVSKLANKKTTIVAMVKPQFEAGNSHMKHKGIIKNDHMRRDILRDFENWAKNYFVLTNKADSKVSGAHGNLERFYLLLKL
jgi:23S rRNA (cytidine1920-2'-O)/16S rRNA (cytidine1409-2'-O)-methyltransferase